MHQTPERFAGKCAIVTGAGHGIGHAIARAFAANGDAVLLADLDPRRAESAADAIRAETGSPAIPIQTDVRCASKAAVAMFTRVLALELAPHEIAVNAVGPGLIEIPGWSHGADYIAAMVAANPSRRMGQPDEIARAVLYLANPATTYVTGTTLYVDGGGLAGRSVPISG